MADAAPKRTAYKVTNTQQGPRGLWSEGLLSYVEADTSALATLTDDEKAAADATGYFDITKATKDDTAALAPDQAPQPNA